MLLSYFIINVVATAMACAIFTTDLHYMEQIKKYGKFKG